MYQGAWVYAGLNPGYHSSVMNSSTGMTVAIASPRAGRAPLSWRFCPEGFTAVSRWQRARSPVRNAIGLPRGRTARYPGPAALPNVAGVLHVTGRPREPTMLSQDKACRDQRRAGQSRAGTLSGSASPGAPRWPAPGLLIADGHQFHRPSSTTVDGTSRVRTRNVSIRTPRARPAPTSRNWVDPCWAPTMAKTENVPPSTRPAEVTVVPVATIARLTASLSGRRCASSLI